MQKLFKMKSCETKHQRMRLFHQKLLAFIRWAVFHGPPWKRNLILFCLQLKVMKNKNCFYRGIKFHFGSLVNTLLLELSF